MDRLDELQRRYKLTAFLYAVQKKFGDDRGGYLAAIITYYGFLAIFPLLLVSFTIAAYALTGNSSVLHSLEKHLGTYPIVGQAVTELQGKKLHGSVVALIAGGVALLLGASGLAQAVQHAMAEMWNIPGKDRPGFVTRMWRSLAWYAVFGVGIVASTFVASLGSILHWWGGTVISALLALVLNVGLFLASFWILTPASVPVRDMLPGSIGAGLVWTFLTGIGIGLTHKLAHSNSLYGSFAPVLGLIAFLYLAARVTIYSVEANAVKANRLWPRSLTNKKLCPADLEQLANLAKREERVPQEEVSVEA